MAMHAPLALIAVLLAALTAAAADTNLLPDPTFEKAAALAANPPKDADVIQLQKLQPWRFYEIELPATVQFQKGTAVLTGGRSFLHSAAFPVEAGKVYVLTFKAKGEGKVSAGFLWWKTYGDDAIEMAKPHWTRPEEAQAAGEKPGEIKISFPAPADATKAYVRFVVTDGSVTISDPVVTPSQK